MPSQALHDRALLPPSPYFLTMQLSSLCSSHPNFLPAPWVHQAHSCIRYSIWEGNGNPLQYSCLENSTDGGAWWATVHRVTKSQTRLSDFTHSFYLKHFPTVIHMARPCTHFRSSLRCYPSVFPDTLHGTAHTHTISPKPLTSIILILALLGLSCLNTFLIYHIFICTCWLSLSLLECSEGRDFVWIAAVSLAPRLAHDKTITIGDC